MSHLHQQQPNRRFLLSGGPAHLVYVYEFGKKNFLFHYDTARIQSKRKKIAAKYDVKISKAKRTVKKQRLINKKANKLAKKDRALAEGNQFMRWGEPLSVYDSTKTPETIRLMKNFLNSRGYYANKIEYQEKLRGARKKKVNLVYDIELGPEYIIDSIQYIIPDWRVKELFESFKSERIVKTGQKIRQPDLNAERDRVYQLLVNRGYYAFSKDYIRFEVDSVTLPRTRLILRQIIANPPTGYGHKVYVIDSVIFVTDAGTQTTKGYPDEVFNKVTYTYGRFKYSPKILDWHNQLYPNKIYERDKVLETQRQLSVMDIYKFINVNFDTLAGHFTAHIFTSPAERFQSSTEIGFSTLSQGLPGPFAQLNLKNRNMFRGLEITEINTNFKVQDNGGVTQDRTYSSILFGSELSITFPQFLSPLGRFYKKKIARFSPRTRFSFAYNLEDRVDEYRRAVYNTSMSYIWKTRSNLSFTLNPMMVSYINSDISAEFRENLDNLQNQGLQSFVSTFQSSVVSAGSLQVTYNDNYGSGQSASMYQFYLETGGHLLGLFREDRLNTNVNAVQFFKYTKGQTDFRKIFQITRNQSLAGRLNIGVAVPYGANKALPYEKYFFAGGSNSIRAWRPRRLGPGGYGDRANDGGIDDTREQPGDMIIEASIEFRQKLSGFVDWALFLDAGNIWLLQSSNVDPSLDPEGDDGLFRFNTFMEEMALAGGFGVRMDLSFLIFRVDLGYKLIDPAQAPGERWVGWDNDIVNLKPFWFRPFKNATLNIGIGYPF